MTFDLNKLRKEHNDLSKDIGKRIKESKGQDKCEVSSSYFIYLIENNMCFYV